MIRWFASKLMQWGYRTAAKVVLGWAEYLDWRLAHSHPVTRRTQR